jgi:hypothetical protein
MQFMHVVVRREIIRWRRDRSVDRCSMTRDAPTAAGGCPTDHMIMPALPMPYNGGRVVIASRASPDEGRDAYLREMTPAKLSEQR